MKKKFFCALAFLSSFLLSSPDDHYDLVINDVRQLDDKIDLESVSSIKIENLKIDDEVFNKIVEIFDDIMMVLNNRGVDKVCFLGNAFFFDESSICNLDYIRTGWISNKLSFIGNTNLSSDVFAHVVYGIYEYGQFEYGDKCYYPNK